MGFDKTIPDKLTDAERKKKKQAEKKEKRKCQPMPKEKDAKNPEAQKHLTNI